MFVILLVEFMRGQRVDERVPQRTRALGNQKGATLIQAVQINLHFMLNNVTCPFYSILSETLYIKFI